jgi:hypothetical protein
MEIESIRKVGFTYFPTYFPKSRLTFFSGKVGAVFATGITYFSNLRFCPTSLSIIRNCFQCCCNSHSTANLYKSLSFDLTQVNISTCLKTYFVLNSDTLFKLTYVVILINHVNMKRCLKSVLNFEFNAPHRKLANFCII